MSAEKAMKLLRDNALKLVHANKTHIGMDSNVYAKKAIKRGTEPA